ncbi:MAG: hypothetical protein IJK56_05235 [Firmicutes bacterium]|nr:hypothetical protein [Bacillota bacterium]
MEYQEKELLTVGRHVFTASYTKDAGDRLLVLAAGDNHQEEMEAVLGAFRESAPVILTFAPVDWDTDYSPWPADGIFKEERGFGGGAEDTLHTILEQGIPAARQEFGLSADPAKTAIMGYSLGGLFAFWSMFKTNAFGMCATCSGSLWYPGLDTFCEEHTICSKNARIYFSLGGKEAKTKNPVMSTIENRTRAFYNACQARQDITATLEMNPGGHFRDVPQRIAKAAAWLFKEQKAGDR